MTRKAKKGRKPAEAAEKEPVVATSRRVALGTYVPEDALWELKELAVRLSRERGRRVTLADLVSEAIADLLTHHRR